MKANYDLSRLIKFAMREPWLEEMQAVLGEHLGEALDQYDLEFDDLDDVLGDQFVGILFGCALEDLMTRKIEPDDRNLVDNYIKKRGLTETTPVKDYMRALQTSVCSLYEVSDIISGTSFLARDLVRGGDPILVREKTATQGFQAWDRICVRIVPYKNGHVMSGGVLPFSLEASDIVLQALREVSTKKRKKGPLSIDDEQLAHLAPLFTTAWLLDVLSKTQGLEEAPDVRNSDGDPLMFHKICYPIKGLMTLDAIAAKIDSHPEMRRETDTFWNWVKPRPPIGTKTNVANTQSFVTTTEEGLIVYGNVEFKGRTVQLSVNSIARAATARVALAKLLGTSVGEPLTEIQTMERAALEHEGQEQDDFSVPEDIAIRVVHVAMDQHYREALDLPISALDNQTPRQAAKSAKGRTKVVQWLKQIENRSAQPKKYGDPMANYDFAWLWTELGVSEHRK
jgi:hypothetical protein